MATNKKRKKKAEVMAEDGSMTLTGHLKELRNRLIICAVVFVVGVVVSLAYADRLIDLLTAMGRDYYQFVSIAPQEKLMQYFRVSILAGVVVTVPVAFYNIYAFAKPGLKKSESTFFKLVMLLGLILFCVGVLFAYKLMMPFMLRFLSTGIEGAEYIQTTTSIEKLRQPLPDHVHHLWLCVRDAADHHHPFQDGHHQPADPQAGARCSHRGHLLHRRCGHPAGHRVPVHGGTPHGAAVLCQHLPERHLL